EWNCLSPHLHRCCNVYASTLCRASFKRTEPWIASGRDCVCKGRGDTNELSATCLRVTGASHNCLLRGFTQQWMKRMQRPTAKHQAELGHQSVDAPTLHRKLKRKGQSLALTSMVFSSCSQAEETEDQKE
ncbi:mCG1063, isoform CRA_b, partial [Mus musculus]